VKQYLIQEHEIGSISSANGEASAYFAAASAVASIAVSIWIAAAFADKMPPEGSVLTHFGAPFGMAVALFFAIMGIRAKSRGNAIWKTIREESSGQSG
jgi:hypothetical protein